MSALSYASDSVRKTKNEYLIMYLLDRGLDDELLSGISNVYNSNKLSQEFKNILKQFNYKNSYKSRPDLILHRLRVKDIVYAIEHDVWSLVLERSVIDDPSLLNDDKVLRSIKMQIVIILLQED